MDFRDYVADLKDELRKRLLGKLDEYILESEGGEGINFWKHFSDPREVFLDFVLHLASQRG